MSFVDFKDEGNTYFKRGNYSEAIKSYNKCIDLEPWNPIGYSNKAMAMIKANLSQDTVKCCQEGLSKVNPNDASHITIRKKLEYRLSLAKNMINDEIDRVETTKSNNVINGDNMNFKEIRIITVDELPQEYSSL